MHEGWALCVLGTRSNPLQCVRSREAVGSAIHCKFQVTVSKSQAHGPRKSMSTTMRSFNNGLNGEAECLRIGKGRGIVRTAAY